MKLALAQMNILWENKIENKKLCARFFEAAAQHGTQLLIFPEMTLTGFTMDVENLAEAREGSQTRAFFRDLSREYGIAVIFGMAQRAVREKKAWNLCILMSEGELLWEYAKLHPFSYGREAQFYQRGTKLVQAQLDDIIIAPQICYDLRFPETFTALSERAHLITVIANWPEGRSSQWDALLRARAIENQCYIAGVNRCGSDPSNRYPQKSSRVYDPYGESIGETWRVEPLREEDGDLVFADIDAAVAERYRAEFPVKKDRVDWEE